MALPSSTYDTATLVNPGSSLTDFTLIVDLSRMSAAWWTAVDTSDGTKGRAAKDSGPTELACDWIDFDSVNETGWLRVKWSGTLASSGTQTLRVYPPQAANASVAASATYGSDNAYDSNWVLYLPFDGDANDRTLYNNNATANGTPTYQAGKVGQETDLDGTVPEWFTVTTSTELEPNGSMTFMVWAQSNAGLSNETISGRGIAPRNWQWYSSGSAQRILFRATDNTTVLATGSATLTTLRHFAAVRDTSVSQIQLYANGATDGSAVTDTTVGKTINTDAQDVAIGDRYDVGSFPWNGTLDDFQMHDTARSADWIEHEYEQTNDQATFWGTWTNVPVAAGISIPVVMHHRRMMGVS